VAKETAVNNIEEVKSVIILNVLTVACIAAAVLSIVFGYVVSIILDRRQRELDKLRAEVNQLRDPKKNRL